MNKRVLDYDPLTGMTTSLHFQGDDMRIVHEQDASVVRGILDGNQRLANSWELTRKGVSKDMVHYARVPAAVIMEWRTKYGVDFYNPDHRKRVFELLNSREYSKLKTTTMVHAE